jgi:cob(I)alamin adenosyltransferase
MKIYTRAGDDGSTGLLGGERTAKDSPRIAAIGDVDEVNAALGLATLYAPRDLAGELRRIQHWLFELGSELACPPGGKFAISTLSEAHVAWLERSIDRQTEALPELKAFILPGGGAVAAHLHLARAVCRRAERTLCALGDHEPVRDVALQFLNRLSDWLFVASRTANAAKGVPDEEWSKAEVTRLDD